MFDFSIIFFCYVDTHVCQIRRQSQSFWIVNLFLTCKKMFWCAPQFFPIEKLDQKNCIKSEYKGHKMQCPLLHKFLTCNLAFSYGDFFSAKKMSPSYKVH